MTDRIIDKNVVVNDIGPFILLEYPARIQNLEKALRTLTIDESSIKLNFDPDDPWGRPIIGDFCNCNCIIMKVTREKASNDIKSYEALGRVEKAARFRRLADFRMLPPEETQEEKQTLSLLQTLNITMLKDFANSLSDERWRTEREFSRNGDILSYPAPRFTASDFPFYLSPSSSSNLTMESTRRKRRQSAWTRHYGDTIIPDNPPKDISSRVRRLHRADFDILTRLFQERPVWLRSALRHYLPNIGTTEFRSMMPAVAYFFMDGPWRCCWVRYGYDPLTDPCARVYQVVEMRAVRIQNMIDMFPTALRKAADATPEKHIFDGVHIVANINQLQYCDLTFSPIQNIILDKANWKEFCEKREGWFIEGTVNKIRTIIKDRWLELVKKSDLDFYEKTIASTNYQPDFGDIENAGDFGESPLAVAELESYLADSNPMTIDANHATISSPSGNSDMEGDSGSDFEIYE